MPTAISYVLGDATRPPVGEARRIIAHVVNDRGGWGKGFVTALSERYPGPERWYRAWSKGKDPESGSFTLGAVQLVPVLPDLAVANLLAQRGYRSAANPVPLDYRALRTCLTKLARLAAADRATVHMPRIGCGLAGGDWTRVAGLIEDLLLSQDVSVTVYDLPDGPVPTPASGP